MSISPPRWNGPRMPMYMQGHSFMTTLKDKIRGNRMQWLIIGIGYMGMINDHASDTPARHTLELDCTRFHEALGCTTDSDDYSTLTETAVIHQYWSCMIPRA